MNNDTSQKLQDLRQILKQNEIQAYIISHGDAHDSEYIADCDERMAYISGFTGSAGFALVTQEEAFLYTDGRYFIQAERELEKGWQLKKSARAVYLWYDFIAEKYGENFQIGYDSMLMTAEEISSYIRILSPFKINLKPITKNLVDAVWKDQPSEPFSQIYEHEYKWHEYKFEDKLKQIREIVQQQNAQLYLNSRLDEIAWVLNLRADDIKYNPVFKSFLILNIFDSAENNGILYVNPSKITESIRKYLNSTKIVVKEYDKIFEDLQKFSKTEKIAFALPEINRRLYESISENNRVEVSLASPICILKAIKSEREQQGFRDCHIRDCSALVSYFAWLENELLVKNNTELTEYTGAKVLEEKRRALEYNMGLSFGAISSIGPNGALNHYQPQEETALKLNPDQVYLLDSGGQYYDGTTDVTRSVHFKNPTSEQKENYTRVLMGNLDVQTLIWPANSQLTGAHIDALARKYLWAKKRDFQHGTGHGVGYFNNIHEGPQGLGLKKFQQVFLKGMTLTDEPGYYKEGEYGFRIEDELLIIDVGDDYLGFENLTMCPYDQNLIEVSLLNKDHIDFINKYHEQVYAKLAPIFEKNSDQLALEWLKKHTKKIVTS